MKSRSRPYTRKLEIYLEISFALRKCSTQFVALLSNIGDVPLEARMSCVDLVEDPSSWRNKKANARRAVKIECIAFLFNLKTPAHPSRHTCR